MLLMRVSLKKILALGILLFFAGSNVFAIEDTQTKKNKFGFFKKDKNEVKLERKKEPKRAKITEIELPPVFSMKNPP